MSLSDKLAKRTFPTKDVSLCLDAALSIERTQALEALAQAQSRSGERLASDGGVKAARKRVAEVEDAMRDSIITLRITGLPFAEYNKCVHACPPRKGKQETFDPTKFFLYVARRSATYVDDDGVHEISGEDWASIEASLTDGEHDQLAGAVIEVNRTQGLAGVGFLGPASTTTPTSSETSE